MRDVIVSDEVSPHWSARARKVMEGLRGEYGFLRDDGSDVSSHAKQILWWNFAGGAANALLAALLQAELGEEVVASNTKLALRKKAGESLVAFQQILERWREGGGPSDD